MNTEIKNVRFITVKGNTYLRAEDVAAMLIDLGSTEPTDTRVRIEELVKSLLMGVP